MGFSSFSCSAFALLAIILTLCKNGLSHDQTEKTIKSREHDKSACLNARDKGDSSCGEAGGLRFYYDKSTKHCQPFVYAGCNGNANRFESANQCKELCFDVSEAKNSGPENSGHSLVVPVPKCEGGVRAAIDSSSRVLNCQKCPKGYTCTGDKCCPSKEYTCLLEYDTGKYATLGSHTPRYFYNKNVNNCLLFTFYGALGNANNFDTYNECVKFCATNANSTKTN